MQAPRTRRRFLIIASATGAGLITGPAACSSSSSTSAASQQAPRGDHQLSSHQHSSHLRGSQLGSGQSGSSPKAGDWAALRRELSSHHLVRPGEHGYGQARELFDPRFDYLRPQGIAYCRQPGDVAACLAFAARFGVPVRARSGGHSYAGWSSVTGGLVADVSQLSSFSVTGHEVTVGAGLGLIDFYSRLAASGLAVPGGSCPTVGIAGLALGGGVGVIGRRYGLTCDNLKSLQIVTANGDVLRCDDSHNADLYWASRGGGGGNFGVATSLTFQAHQLPSLVLFSLTWPWSSAARVVDAWQRWAPHAPDELWSTLHLIAQADGGAPTVGVSGTWAGSAAGATAQLDDFYTRVGSRPGSSFVRGMPYLDAMLVEAGCSGYSLRECSTRSAGRLPRVPSYAKSDFFTRRLSAAGITVMLDAVAAMRGAGGTSNGVGAIALDAFGGALNRVHPKTTAFVHRNSLFLAQYSTSWTYPGSSGGVARQHRWLRSAYAAVHPHASGQAYQNYVDPDLADWRRAYYGENYARLARVKARYDPHQLFRFPQGITAS